MKSSKLTKKAEFKFACTKMRLHMQFIWKKTKKTMCTLSSPYLGIHATTPLLPQVVARLLHLTLPTLLTLLTLANVNAAVGGGGLPRFVAECNHWIYEWTHSYTFHFHVLRLKKKVCLHLLHVCCAYMCWHSTATRKDCKLMCENKKVTGRNAVFNIKPFGNLNGAVKMRLFQEAGCGL